MTFIDFDVCNLAATLPVLYSVTLTYFFNVKYFKYFLENGDSKRKILKNEVYTYRYLPSNSTIFECCTP